MAAKRPTRARLDAIEKKAKMQAGTTESMVIGLVGPGLVLKKSVQLIGRTVREVFVEPQIMIPEVFGDYLYPAMIKVARGGRGSAKTQSFIRIILARMQATRTHVGCFREIQKSIQESIKQQIETVIADIGLSDQFYITKTEISHPGTGSKMIFAGLKHNVTNVKGMDWIDIAFCEEAENISDDSWNVLIPTLRKDGAELMVCYNPKNILDATHMKFGPGACAAYVDDEHGNRIRYSITKQVNYDKNPFFTTTSRLQMEAMKKEDEELYEHIWLGMPNADSEHAIIKPSWIQAAVDAHLVLGFKPSGQKRIGQDVADGGKDTSALIQTHGVVAVYLDEWKKGDTNFTANRAYDYAVEIKADALVYDSIGVGAGVKAQLKKRRDDDQEKAPNSRVFQFEIHGFNAGGAVIDPDDEYTDDKTNGDMFSNVKAQAWWSVRDRFYKTYRAVKEGAVYDPSELISLSSKLDQLEKLKAELSRPMVDYDGAGKVKVESKKDMAKRGIPSPNLADALIMCFAPVEHEEYGLLV